MRPRWVPVWLWQRVYYRPEPVTGITLRTDGDDLVVTIEQGHNGREIEVIREYGCPVSGSIDHHVTSIGIRAEKRRWWLSRQLP